MPRLLLPFATAFVLILGLGTFAVAQDASPTAEMGQEEKTCLEALGTPSASPQTAETEAATETPTTMTQGSPVASPGAEMGCQVDIRDRAFTPAIIEIEVGTTVTWENYDPPDRVGVHTVTADDGTFDSGEFGEGETFSHTFGETGVFPYHCEIHPVMTGTVIVR